MGVITGTRYSFSDAANIAIDMSDTLGMISPFDVPFLSRVGKSSLSTQCVATKHEWLESSLRGLTSIVVTQGKFSAGTDPADDVVMTTGSGVLFRAGDIWKFESELVRVAATPASDTLNFIRAYGGSSAVSHANGTVGQLIGNVNVQDAAVGASRTTTKSGFYNYTQLYEDAVRVTSTEAAIKKYVEQNTMTAALRDAMRSAWMQWENTLLHGRKVAPSAGVASAMDGVLVKITTNAYAKAGALLIEDHLRTALKDIWVAGGGGELVAFLNSFQKEQVNKLLDGLRQTDLGARTAGVRVNRYESEYANVEFVLDRNMPTDTVLICDMPRIGFGPLSNNGVSHALRAIPIPATTGTVEVMQILGQYTSETRNENAHAKITGLATS
jgi:hypothetical protein